MMGFVLLLRGCISLHACAVAIDDRAVAIVGPAGAGKSTTAAALADQGYSILAEDVVTLQDLERSVSRATSLSVYQALAFISQSFIR
jgi:serine kinase of HPr protein (carbohydrate metabolism regulator)